MSDHPGFIFEEAERSRWAYYDYWDNQHRAKYGTGWEECAKDGPCRQAQPIIGSLILDDPADLYHEEVCARMPEGGCVNCRAANRWQVGVAS